MTSLTHFAAVVAAYTTYCGETLAAWRPCPQCGRPRAWQGTRARWVQWAPGRRDRLGWRRLRCRPCRTVETVFPPWIVPYEELLLDGLATVVVAAGQGASRATVAATGGVAPLTARRRWRRWGPGGVWLRQRILQQATIWGWHFQWPTWTPPARARSADWAWLAVAWAALALLIPPPAVAPHGWVGWAATRPTAWPPGGIPLRTHLGQRVAAAAGVPP